MPSFAKGNVEQQVGEVAVLDDAAIEGDDEDAAPELVT
jgi:hypothetical protein